MYRKLLLRIVFPLIGIYVLICGTLYLFQEKLIFHPEQLENQFSFGFQQPFEEVQFKTNDETLLHGLHFKVKQPKGLIFYLHGNAGSLKTWGKVGELYAEASYDTFILDYRGFGKSEGKIESEQQLFEDNQMIYNELKKQYPENHIIILGYSIGTGMAAKLASENHPKRLILKAPYYSLVELMKEKVSFIPTSILKYDFQTYQYLKKCKMPVTIFHGNQDQVIPFEHALKLKSEFKKGDSLITLQNQGHNGIKENLDYVKEMGNILK